MFRLKFVMYISSGTTGYRNSLASTETATGKIENCINSISSISSTTIAKASTTSQTKLAITSLLASTAASRTSTTNVNIFLKNQQKPSGTKLFTCKNNCNESKNIFLFSILLRLICDFFF